MTREDLAAMLGDRTPVREAARDALLTGGAFAVWDGPVPADRLAHLYRGRLRRTRAHGQRTRDLPATVAALEQSGGEPLRLGRVKAADGSWTFLVFLDAAATAVVACTGVARTRQGHDADAP